MFMSRENGKRGILSHIFWILVLGGFIYGCVFFAPYIMDVFGLEQKGEKVVFEVLPDDTTDTISHKLKENGIVLSARTYRTIVKREHGNLTYKPGAYTLNANMSFEKIVSVFQSEPDVDKSIVKVTFPEGKTVAEMAEILEENGICKAADFLKSQQEDEFDFDFIEEIENVEERGYRLEGYLFPATYDFQKNTDAKDIVKAMLKAFDERITPAMKTRMVELNINLDKIVTLASIIQAEANSEDAIKNVSAVFWNRLNGTDLPKLQSDPTKAYAQKLKDDGILPQEKSVKFDTYESEGLPPGPQNNPGINMIEGALYPAEVEYTYFVTDAKGNFYYANTYEAHRENCANAGIQVPY